MSRNGTPLARARQYEREEGNWIPAEERPLFHLTPQIGWMNDPNGFCYYQGKYHLFYQYHPYSTYWGPMHWGHAISTDLLRWTYEPCALAPDTEADAGGCFSGSAVELSDGRLMLCYTGVQPAATFRKETQAQCVAFGDGVNFEKESQNPVLRQTDLSGDYSEVDFRDPKVWKEQDGTLRMAVANRQRERQGTILLLRSTDGLKWELMGEIASSCGEYGKMWECPDFFSLDGKQILIVSPQEMQARGEFHAGFGTVAFLGTFHEDKCAFVQESVQPIDHGLNFYAPQTVLAPDGRRIMIGWMENWETCKEAPRNHAWYAQMSVPRELSLRDGRLVQQPVREIETLWKDTVMHEGVTVQEETSLAGVQGRMLDLSIIVRPESESCRRFVLHLAKNENYFTQVRCDFARGELIFDRSHGGSRRDIAHTRHVPAMLKNGELALRILMDRESVEIFINQGERVVTALIPTPQEADGITFAADGPLRMNVTAHKLRG